MCGIFKKKIQTQRRDVGKGGTKWVKVVKGTNLQL